ncbi:MAG: nucleotidyltransferase domain-containing protein [Armatimonadota bacterium]|nr:nucleotidyltransferase domain-containing protein [Armatimonadota bacterium]
MDLTAQQAERLAQVAARFGLRLIVAFGSRATRRVHAGSDLDLAILPAPGREIGFRELADLLADLFAIFPDADVDLALIPHADPLFLKKIFETGVLLYGDAVEFRRYRVYAFRRYSEYLPYLRLEEAATRALVRRLCHAD